MAADEEILDVSDDELAMLKRIRETKVDPKTIAEPKAGDNENPTPAGAGEGEGGKPKPAAEPGADVEERVFKAVAKVTEEVKLKATRDQEARENVAAMTDMVKADPKFRKFADEDPIIYRDVQERVSLALKDAESIEKIKTMDRPAYLEHIAELTGAVLQTMKDNLGVKDPDNTDLDTRLAGASTGVGGSGGRRGGSGTERSEEEPPELDFGAMDRSEPYPTQAQIDRKHDKRVAIFLKKEGLN